MSALKKITAVLIAVLVVTATVGLVASPAADARPGAGTECPSGSIEDNKGMCRKPVADAHVCPKGTLGAPGGCYIFVPKVMKKTFTFN